MKLYGFAGLLLLAVVFAPNCPERTKDYISADGSLKGTFYVAIGCQGGHLVSTYTSGAPGGGVVDIDDSDDGTPFLDFAVDGSGGLQVEGRSEEGGIVSGYVWAGCTNVETVQPPDLLTLQGAFATCNDAPSPVRRAVPGDYSYTNVSYLERKGEVGSLVYERASQGSLETLTFADCYGWVSLPDSSPSGGGDPGGPY